MYWVAQYYPQDIYVGTRAGGRLRPTLFFRDVGSHDDAPHALAVDGRGQCHLVVADVNIYQDNRLDLYWVIGDPRTGRWTEAHLIDRRGFTSWSHPWSTARGDEVHLLWSWVDATAEGAHPDSGLFYVVRSGGRFSRKVRVARGPISAWEAAIDAGSGTILVAFSAGNDVYLLSRTAGEAWTRPAKLHEAVYADMGVTVAPAGDGAFVVRVQAEKREWLVRPR
jgi:hypothetical protein